MLTLALTSTAPASAPLSFGAPAASAAPTSTALTFGAPKPAATATPAAPSTALATTSAAAKPAVNAAAPVPSMLRGKTLEDIVNSWSAELEERTRDFSEIAGEVREWDTVLRSNGEQVRGDSLWA